MPLRAVVVFPGETQEQTRLTVTSGRPPWQSTGADLETTKVDEAHKTGTPKPETLNDETRKTHGTHKTVETLNDETR